MTPTNLDTIGAVGPYVDPKDGMAGFRLPLHGGARCLFVTWDELTLFEQGYIEALLRSVSLAPIPASERWIERPGFSDLAPETLARIMGDCGRFRHQGGARIASRCRSIGALFWKNRSGNYLSDDGWMPLTPYLGDDGTIYLREASDA